MQDDEAPSASGCRVAGPPTARRWRRPPNLQQSRRGGSPRHPVQVAALSTRPDTASPGRLTVARCQPPGDARCHATGECAVPRAYFSARGIRAACAEAPAREVVAGHAPPQYSTVIACGILGAVGMRQMPNPAVAAGTWPPDALTRQFPYASNAVLADHRRSGPLRAYPRPTLHRCLRWASSAFVDKVSVPCTAGRRPDWRRRPVWIRQCGGWILFVGSQSRFHPRGQMGREHGRQQTSVVVASPEVAN